jgi:transposase
MSKEEQMNVGIDIALKKFDATVQAEPGAKTHATFANNTTGFARLVKWLQGQGREPAHICMEATNVYWEALAEFLHGQGYAVSVVNPARIAGHARSQMRRNKTDKVDSEVICDFCATQQPDLWTPPSAVQKQLRSLERHRDDLEKTLTQEKNRLSTCSEPWVRQSLQRLIETLQDEMAQVDAQLKDLIAQNADLTEQFALLTSIPSLGPRTATKLMAEMYDLATYTDAAAAAADAGVSPANHESGETVRKKTKLSKVGKAAVRGALYFPAMSAIRFNPFIRNLAQRLREKGKTEMVIIGAAMRKLLYLAYGVLKHKKPFDPNYIQPTSVPT